MDHVIDYPKSTLPAEFKLRKAPGSGEGVIVEVTKVKGVTQASAKSTIYNCTYVITLCFLTSRVLISTILASLCFFSDHIK